ncbi:MAG: hypothetical protein COA42_14400 [Alteromonadaceae bacterium]|nr:MAG: hypothetical protein COA42_14400 [Alteromonadaceae bacterium]
MKKNKSIAFTVFIFLIFIFSLSAYSRIKNKENRYIPKELKYKKDPIITQTDAEVNMHIRTKTRSAQQKCNFTIQAIDDNRQNKETLGAASTYPLKIKGVDSFLSDAKADLLDPLIINSNNTLNITILHNLKTPWRNNLYFKTLKTKPWHPPLKNSLNLFPS